MMRAHRLAQWSGARPWRGWTAYLDVEPGPPADPDAAPLADRVDRDPAASGSLGRHEFLRHGLVGMAATTAVAAGSTIGGSAFTSVIPGAWFFGTPGGPLGSLSPAGLPSALALLFVFGGLIVLVRTWLHLLKLLRAQPNSSVRWVLGAIAMWSIPLLIAAPLFSHDIYSYVGQGEMVSHHIDPYRYGTGVLGSTPFTSQATGVWSNSPSPYGPVFLWLDGLAIVVAGHHELADLVLLRLLALVGLALAALAIPPLARRAGRDPAHAVLLGIGSPLVMTTLVGGAHNDALMIGLLLAGLAVAKRYGPVPGIALCALAIGVKAPAALAIVVIGWNWAGPAASTRQRIGRAVGATAIGAVVLGVVSAMTGVGWGWTRTLDTASQVQTGVTPMSAIAHVISGIPRVVGVHLSYAGTRTAVDAVGIVCAGVICAWLLSRAPKLGTVRTVGFMLLIVALFGPILWAWYLTWGVVVLSVAAEGRLRKLLVAIAVLWTFIGVSGVDRIARSAWDVGLPADLLLIAGLVGLALMPIGLRPRRRDRRSDHSPAGVTSDGTPPHPSGPLTPRTVTELV
jgi:hypothetical protein